jgi:hypothetical protein
MLRDEGGRLADEDSQVYIGSAPGRQNYDFDFDEQGPADPPPAQPSLRPDVPAKPAVVVGLAQAQAGKANRSKRSTAAPPPPPGAQPRRAATIPPPIPGQPPPPPPRARNESRPPPRRAVPAPFGEEPTRQVDDELLSALRANEQQQQRQKAPTHLPSKTSPPPTKTAPPLSKLPPSKAPPPSKVEFEEPTRMANIDAHLRNDPLDKFLSQAPSTDLNTTAPETLEDNDEATKMASLDGIAAMERARKHPVPQDERTRAVNIRNDKSISDIDWDLD